MESMVYSAQQIGIYFYLDLPILQIIDLVLLLLSLYFHNDMLLIVAAVVIAVCVVLTFSNMKNKR